MESRDTNFTSGSFLRTIKIIHLMLLAGMILFGFVILFITDSWDSNLPSTDDVFIIVVPILAISGVVAGRFIYKSKIDNLKSISSLKDKLTTFQTALIIKLAMVEGPFLFGVVAAQSTQNIIYLVISGILALYFITLKPSKSKVINDLKLNREMEDQFNDKNQSLN